MIPLFVQGALLILTGLTLVQQQVLRGQVPEPVRLSVRQVQLQTTPLVL